MKHMAGNLRSRFTDFLTTDGEKPDRNRDGEFEIDGQSRPRRDHGGLGERLGAALRHAERADARPTCSKDVRVRGERAAGPRRSSIAR